MTSPLSTDPLEHGHQFRVGNPEGEKGTRHVVLLTFVMMVIEIIGGWWWGSMALLADGWHMGSHVLALGITLLAYALSRKFSADKRFCFGTWKIEVLGGFSSALLLVLVAAAMIWESVVRLQNPVPIAFNQAIFVAVIGLCVNLASAFLLQHKGSEHSHSHGHGHGHGHGGDDLNLRAAYLHVMADAMTSIFAIAALVGGKYFGWIWLDPMMGIIGAIVVGVWGWGLIRTTSNVLLDREMNHPVVDEVREIINAEPDTTLTDLHVWRVAQDQYACVVALTTADPKPPEYYRRKLQVHEELVHITVEVNPSQV